ncbi:MAG: hypothetical protein WKG01_12330 [Kofleriaceae bacterium]
MIRSFLILVVGLAFAGCAGTKQQPALRVIKTPNHEVVFVQVTNTAKRPLRLTKLEYSFAAGNSTVSQGAVELFEREIPAGAMAVVEVPLETEPGEPVGPMTLRGKLTAELDQIVRTFKVSAEIEAQPQAVD